MSKKRRGLLIIIALLLVLGFVSSRSTTVKGTITGFDNDTVIVTSKDGTQVFTINN